MVVKTLSKSNLGNQFNDNIQELVGIVDEYEKQLKKILLENEELKDKIRQLEEETILKKDIVERDTQNRIHDSAISTGTDESLIDMLEKSHPEVMDGKLWIYLFQCWDESDFQSLSKSLHYAINQDRRWNYSNFAFMQFNNHVWNSTPKHDEEKTPIYLYLLVLYQQLFHTSWNLETTGFLKSEFSSIQNQVISTNMPEVIVELLKCFLYYDLDHELGELMQTIIEEEWSFLDDNIDKREYITFLWYAFYFGLDNNLIDASKTCKSYLNDSSAEFLLYKRYGDLLAGQSGSSEISELREIRNKMKHFDEIEEAKIFLTLDKLFQHIPNQESIPVTDKVFQIKPKTENCPTCMNQRLILKHAKIYTYLNPKFENQVGLVEGNFLFCSKCNYFFGRHDLLLNLRQHANPNHILSILHPKDYPPKEKKESVKLMDPNSFKWPSTHAEESRGIHQTDSNFQDQTALNRIGYKITGLTRIKRWDILSRKAIPTMTLKEIVYTIAMLVKVRKSQKGGKTRYAYSIAEWEYDLQKLKEEYYKRNFTWPNY